jgi:hypothetical protein
MQGDMLQDHLAACATAVLSGGLSKAESRRLADEVGRLVARLC